MPICVANILDLLSDFWHPFLIVFKCHKVSEEISASHKSLSLFHRLRWSQKSKSALAAAIGQEAPRRRCLQLLPRITGIQDAKAFTSLANQFTSSFVGLLTCLSEQKCLFSSELSIGFPATWGPAFFSSLLAGSFIEHNAGQTSALPWPARLPNMALPLKSLDVVQHCAQPLWGRNIIGGKWTMSWSLYACVTQGTAAARTKLAIV